MYTLIKYLHQLEIYQFTYFFFKLDFSWHTTHSTLATYINALYSHCHVNSSSFFLSPKKNKLRLLSGFGQNSLFGKNFFFPKIANVQVKKFVCLLLKEIFIRIFLLLELKLICVNREKKNYFFVSECKF